MQMDFSLRKNGSSSEGRKRGDCIFGAKNGVKGAGKKEKGFLLFKGKRKRIRSILQMVARLANRIKRVVKSRKLEARSNLEEATYDFMTFEENEEHSLPTCNRYILINKRADRQKV